MYGGHTRLISVLLQDAAGAILRDSDMRHVLICTKMVRAPHATQIPPGCSQKWSIGVQKNGKIIQIYQ